MPVTSSSAPPSNRILSRLSRDDWDLLAPHLSPIDLPLRKRLETPDKMIEHVYFIEGGFASIVAGRQGQSIEVGLVGGEGMTGLAVLLGAHSSPNATYMQSAGRGLRISSAHLRNAEGRSATLRGVLLQYTHAFIVQTAQTALANGRSKVEERLARWILMAHDRLDGDDLALTHEFLAIMLGVRRAGVTVALNILEDKALVRARRGVISVLDRKGLEKITDGAYGVAEAEYERLFGPG